MREAVADWREALDFAVLVGVAGAGAWTPAAWVAIAVGAAWLWSRSLDMYRPWVGRARAVGAERAMYGLMARSAAYALIASAAAFGLGVGSAWLWGL